MKQLPFLMTLALCLLGVHNLAAQSSFYESPLLISDWQADECFLDAPQGFAHPFQSWSKLGNSIIDAFAPGSPEYALLRYGHRDEKMDFGCELNFIAGYDHRLEQEQSYGFVYKGLKLKSRLNKSISANAFWWNGVYTQDRDAAENLSPLVDGYLSKTPTKTRLDNLNADLTYQNSWLKLSLARGRPFVANNLSGSIILSDRVNDFGYFEAKGRLGAIHFSLLQGSLVADSSRSQAKMAGLDLPDKYVALHEIGWQINQNWKAAAGELVIYGDRGFDINYLLPHTFWRVAEHNQHDRDNVLIYTGIDGLAHPNLQLWFRLALDEFSYGKILGSWWGNKWAVQSGAALKIPALAVCKEAPKLSTEIVAVRPWTYTHYQNQTMYSHDRRSLGHPQGSNQVSAFLELDYPLSYTFQIHAQASWKRQGSVGNNWRINYNDVFANDYHAETHWLEGEKTDTLELASMLNIRLAHLQFYAGQRLKKIKTWQHSLFGGLMFQY